MKTIYKKNLLLLLFILLVDQLSKIVVINKLSYGEVFHINRFLNFVIAYNHGVTFGMLKAYSNIQFLILSTMILVVLCIVVFWWVKSENNLQRYANTIIIAGALGNIMDRIRFKAVVDFIDFHIANWHWYTFNIADSAIVIGVFMLLIDSYVISKKNHSV